MTTQLQVVGFENAENLSSLTFRKKRPSAHQTDSVVKLIARKRGNRDGEGCRLFPSADTNGLELVTAGLEPTVNGVQVQRHAARLDTRDRARRDAESRAEFLLR